VLRRLDVERIEREEETAHEPHLASSEPRAEPEREEYRDRAYQHAIRDLFDSETDPILIIKWKEVLDMLEMVTDACEDVANVIEGVVVKHG